MFTGPQHTFTLRGSNLRFLQTMPTEADTRRKLGVPKRPSPKRSFFGLEAREPNLVIALTGGDWAICRSCQRAESSRFVTSLRPCDAQSGYSLQWRLLGASAGGGWQSWHHLETGSHLLTWLISASAPVHDDGLMDGDKSESYEQKRERREHERREAIRKIWNAGGEEIILELTQKVRQPWAVGWALAPAWRRGVSNNYPQASGVQQRSHQQMCCCFRLAAYPRQRNELGGRTAITGLDH